MRGLRGGRRCPLPRLQQRSSRAFAVRDDQTGADVGAVAEHGHAVAVLGQPRVPPCPRIRGVARHRPGRHHEAGLRIDDDLRVRREPVVTRGGTHTTATEFFHHDRACSTRARARRWTAISAPWWGLRWVWPRRLRCWMSRPVPWERAVNYCRQTPKRPHRKCLSVGPLVLAAIAIQTIGDLLPCGQMPQQEALADEPRHQHPRTLYAANAERHSRGEIAMGMT